MSSAVHFKFRSSLMLDVVHFDGPDISLADLKREIAKLKRLDKYLEEYDLSITSHETNAEFKAGDRIPRNSSVVVARVPMARHRKGQKSGTGPTLDRRVSAAKEEDDASTVDCINKMAEVANMNVSEEAKLSMVMNQGSTEFEAAGGGRARRHPTGPVPSSYICHKCLVPGHFIHNCPKLKDKNFEQGPKLKKTLGIPTSFLTYVSDINIPGVMVTPGGSLAVPNIEADTFKNIKKEKFEIPSQYLCPICNELQTNSVVLPCCSNSCCDNCVVTKLLQSDASRCPVCKKSGTSIADIVPNEKLRTDIINHKHGLITVPSSANNNVLNNVKKEEPFEDVHCSENTSDNKDEIKTSTPESEANELITRIPVLQSSDEAQSTDAKVGTPQKSDSLTSTGMPIQVRQSGHFGPKNVMPTTRPLSPPVLAYDAAMMDRQAGVFQNSPNVEPMNVHHFPNVAPQFLIQYGGTQMLGFVPQIVAGPHHFPGYAPIPMTREQFYREQINMRNLGRGRRSPNRSISPRYRRAYRSPEWSNRYESDRYHRQRSRSRRRSRSRSYERARTRSGSPRRHEDKRRAERLGSKVKDYRSQVKKSRSPSPMRKLVSGARRKSARESTSPMVESRPRSVTPEDKKATNVRRRVEEEALGGNKKAVKRKSYSSRSPSPDVKKNKKNSGHSTLEKCQLDTSRYGKNSTVNMTDGSRLSAEDTSPDVSNQLCLKKQNPTVKNEHREVTEQKADEEMARQKNNECFEDKKKVKRKKVKKNKYKEDNEGDTSRDKKKKMNTGKDNKFETIDHEYGREDMSLEERREDKKLRHIDRENKYECLRDEKEGRYKRSDKDWKSKHGRIGDGDDTYESSYNDNYDRKCDDNYKDQYDDKYVRQYGEDNKYKRIHNDDKCVPKCHDNHDREYDDKYERDYDDKYKDQYNDKYDRQFDEKKRICKSNYYDDKDRKYETKKAIPMPHGKYEGAKEHVKQLKTSEGRKYEEKKPKGDLLLKANDSSVKTTNGNKTSKNKTDDGHSEKAEPREDSKKGKHKNEKLRDKSRNL